jgi:hypothetical protein
MECTCGLMDRRISVGGKGGNPDFRNMGGVLCVEYESSSLLGKKFAPKPLVFQYIELMARENLVIRPAGVYGTESPAVRRGNDHALCHALTAKTI